MLNKPLLAFLAFISISFIQVIAQNPSKTVYNHGVFWSKIEINDILPQGGNKWGYGFDFVYRTKNEFNSGSIFSIPLRESYRPWLHYQFNENARLSFSPIGYMFTNEYVGKPSDLNRMSYHEWRSTVQFFHHLYSGKNNRFMHTYRYRYELRWQYNPLVDDYRYFNRFRIRYRVRYLINKPSFYDNHLWYASVSNEIGINLGKNVNYMFNQNRFYAGIGFRFANAARIEARYINRIRGRGATGFEYDQGQGFMLGLYIDKLSKINFDASKKIPPVRFYD